MQKAGTFFRDKNDGIHGFVTASCVYDLAFVYLVVCAVTSTTKTTCHYVFHFIVL